MPTARFPKTRRLSGAKPFARVFEAKCSASDRVLVIYAAANGLSLARLGLSVGRKLGSAVARNRIKRLMREAFRLEDAAWAGGYDLICIPKIDAKASLKDFRESIPKVGARAIQRYKATYV